MTDLTYSRKYELPNGYSVEFALDNGRLDARWSPRCPKFNRISKKLLHAYRDARNDFIGGLGVNALVVEI